MQRGQERTELYSKDRKAQGGREKTKNDKRNKKRQTSIKATSMAIVYQREKEAQKSDKTRPTNTKRTRKDTHLQQGKEGTN